ncbi:MAG: hypothetical protein FWD05_07745, partial [Oscillospiraceae bacterium]|nr:hypothetical protein [Oscillospiraceae bacterium]
MLDSADLKSWDELDKAAAKAGGYLATPKRPLVIEHDYRAMSRYCTEKGIDPADLSESEEKMFEYSKPLIYS